MRRAGENRLPAFFALVVLVLTACQAQVDVDLDVAADGSGTVSVVTEFDAEANTALDGVISQLRIADLQDSGWDVEAIDSDDGGAVVTATKPVASASQWQGVLDEIAGPNVFNDVVVQVVDGRQRVGFELDLSDGWMLFADDELTEALGGEPFGAPLDELTDGRPIDDIVDVDLSATVRNFDDREPTSRSISPRFDDRAQSFTVVATAENSTAILLGWVSIALFSLFGLALVLAIAGIVLQRRSDRLRVAVVPSTLSTRVPGRTPEAAQPAAGGAAAEAPETQSVRLVVVDALAVLYGLPRALEQEILPFVRERDGTARGDTIAEGYGSVVAGVMTTAAFWELCGIEGRADELDDELVAGRDLVDGVPGFLRELQRRRIPLAALSADAEEWSQACRSRDRLSVIWPWLVSAEVGVRSDDVAMFEVLRRESGVAYGHCLFVDGDVDRLDAARELGMRTALFDTGAIDLPKIVNHPVVDDLDDLLG